MKVKRVDEKHKKIEIEIPLTTPTGKIRIKKRNNYTDFGIPIAPRQERFTRNMYVEWQIGYDLKVTSKKKNLSTLSSNETLTFVAYNGQEKVLYELSEYLYYFYKMNVFSQTDIKNLISFVSNISDENLIERRYDIWKSQPKEVNINGMRFLESEIKYPHLIYDFNNGFFVIAEITIREKQRAVGIQPMLYVCFPVSCLKDENGNSILGRTARTNEKAILELNQNNAFITIEIFKIFGMLSAGHKHDVLKILKLIKSI